MAQISFVVAACFLALSWLSSSHFMPWTSWHAETAAFFAVLLSGWIGVIHVIRGIKTRRSLIVPRSSLIFVILSVIAIAQGVIGLVPFRGDIWVFCFYMALCIACTMLGFELRLRCIQCDLEVNKLFVLLAFTILFGAIASSLIALIQVFGVWEYLDWIVRSDKLRRPGSNLAQSNHLATLLVMGIASLVFLYELKKMRGSTSVLILFLLGAGIALTESRTGVLSFLMVLGWWLFKGQGIVDRAPKWIGVGAAFVILGMFWAWPHALSAMELLGSDAKNRMLEEGLRLQVWSQLLNALSMHPWTGWGIQRISAAHNAVVSAYAISEPFTYSHNLILDLALWIGVPLALLVIISATLWFWRCARRVNGLLSWYGVATALPLGVHSMLEYPHAYAYFLVPVMFLLGAVEASTGGKPLTRIGVRPAVAMLLVATTTFTWTTIEYLKIEEDFRVALFQSLRIGAPPPEHVRPRIVFFDQLGVLLDGARITPAPRMTHAEMWVLENAALRYPWLATQYRYALALALNDKQEEAVRQIRIARLMWGESAYRRIKGQILELADTNYPELLQLKLP